MSMSTHVIGIKPADETFKSMKKIWDLCEATGVEIPKKVSDFFNGEKPDELGVTVSLTGKHGVVDYNRDSTSGYELDIRKLPSDIKIVRFVNSW